MSEATVFVVSSHRDIRRLIPVSTMKKTGTLLGGDVILSDAAPILFFEEGDESAE